MELHCPGWDRSVGEVEYYDPLMVRPQEVSPPMSKHFRYTYQKEVRFAWVPPSNIGHLEPLQLDIGPLTDIAELVLPEPEQEVGETQETPP